MSSHFHTSNQLHEGSRIYYNLKLANIYANTEEVKTFDVKDDCSIILEKQSNYRMAIQSFRLDIDLPVFLFPIKEGFDTRNNLITISLISNANPAVVNTATNHGLNVNDYINIEGVVNMNINGNYFVHSVVSPNEITLKTEITSTQPINSTNLNVYTSGGIISQVNNNINLSDFGFCFRRGTNDYASPVFYIPDKNLTLNPLIVPLSPRENKGLQDKSTNYYYTNTFEVFAEMLNTALATITTAMNTGEGLTLEAPFFEFDNLTGRFSFIVPYGYITNNISIFSNSNLSNYLVGLRYEFQGLNQPNFKDYRYIIQNYEYKNSYVKKGSSLPVPPTLPTYLQFKQEYDGRYKFDEIVSLILTSDYIKTRSEFFPKIGNPNSYFTAGKSNNSFNTGTTNILSSFDLIDSEGSLSWREVQYYYPKLYKWVDLISNDGLNKMDCKIFFETKKGDLLPVLIDSNSLSNVRFVFEKIQ
jgi:hypothetical protein